MRWITWVLTLIAAFAVVVCLHRDSTSAGKAGFIRSTRIGSVIIAALPANGLVLRAFSNGWNGTFFSFVEIASSEL